MLCRRIINSPDGLHALPGSVITCETLTSYAQADNVVEQAKAQARQLLQEANEQREHLLENAGLEIWQRADAQLKRWETERQALCDSLEQYATKIVNQAMFLLLEETPPPQRIKALFKQLLACHVPAIKAMLVCNPHELETVRQYLESDSSNCWALRAKNTIEPQTLILNTEEGDFRIDWISLVSALVKHDNVLGLIEAGSRAPKNI